MTTWHCRVSTASLRLGLMKVQIGVGDASTALGSVRLHVMKFTRNDTSIHLTGSDGAHRGALYHLKCEPLRTPDLWCIVPPAQLFQTLQSDFNTSQTVDLGTATFSGPLYLTVLDRSSGMKVDIPIRPNSGYNGIGCFANRSFREVEKWRYWVKGDLTPFTEITEADELTAPLSSVDEARYFEEVDEYAGEYNLDHALEVESPTLQTKPGDALTSEPREVTPPVAPALAVKPQHDDLLSASPGRPNSAPPRKTEQAQTQRTSETLQRGRATHGKDTPR